MGFFSIFKSKETEASAPEQDAAAALDILIDDGIRAMKMGEMRYAEKCFAKAAEISSDDFRAVKYLAEARLRLQDFEGALPLLQNVADAEPENFDAHLLLAQTLGQTGNYAAMQEACAALLSAHPDEPRVCYLAGEAAHGVGDEFAAIAMLTKSLASQENFAAARLLRAKILAGMGQYAEVLEDTGALLEADAENEDFLLLHADALSATGRTDEAEQTYMKVCEQNPFCREGVLRLAGIYVATARRDKALQVLDGAIEMLPDFAEAYQLRGGIKMELNDKIGAADDLKKSLELSPELSAALDGEFSNLENRMAERYRSLNPYGF